MLTHRVPYLGLIACLVTTTALGLQPQLIGSALVEQESEADFPGEEPGEKEVKSDSGIPARRRGTLLIPTVEFRPTLLRDSRSVTLPLRPSAHAPGGGNRNGFGGPLRL